MLGLWNIHQNDIRELPVVKRSGIVLSWTAADDSKIAHHPPYSDKRTWVVSRGPEFWSSLSPHRSELQSVEQWAKRVLWKFSLTINIYLNWFIVCLVGGVLIWERLHKGRRDELKWKQWKLFVTSFTTKFETNAVEVCSGSWRIPESNFGEKAVRAKFMNKISGKNLCDTDLSLNIYWPGEGIRFLNICTLMIRHCAEFPLV
jgi:hypothetical protein